MKTEDRKLESIWNDAKGYLEMIRLDITEFNKHSETGQFDMAYRRIISATDNLYPYLVKFKIDDNLTFWASCENHLEIAKKELFRKDYNLKDEDDRKEKAQHDNIGFDNLRNVKQILLRCLDRCRALLPMEYKDEWYIEVNKYN